MRKLNAVAIGGAHQFPHFLPVAFELAARGAFRVEIFVARAADVAHVERLARSLDMDCPPVTVMRLPLLEHGERTRRFVRKKWRLFYWASRLRAADAILCAERTSTFLKKLPGRCPPMLHFRHGAGDRAVGFESRIALFDQVLTVGEKDRDRTIAQGLLPAGRCHVAGPVKLAAIALGPDCDPLFDNGRPVILYNPHFHETLGSFEAVANRLIADVLADGRYNLIVAPHVRLAEGWDEAEIARWEDRSVAGRLIVDMGSERSLDMSYTLAADLYVGDVSSQVYEFIQQPRPCLFVDMAGSDWANDVDFSMWHMGPVVRGNADPLAAIDRAFASFDSYREAQSARARAAVGALMVDISAAERREQARSVLADAADLVTALIDANCDANRRAMRRSRQASRGA